MRVRLPLLTIAGFLTAPMAQAQEAKASQPPVIGYLYSNPPHAFIIYDCTRVDDNRIACDLTQVRARKKVKADEVPAKMADAMRPFDAPISKADRDGTMCERIPLMVDWLEGRIPITALPPEVAKELRKKEISPEDKPDVLKTSKAIAAMCIGNDVPMKALARESVERDTRTCLVSGHTFSQTFQRADSGQGGTSWVVRGEPGPCGLVQVSRFEQAPNTMFGWRYVGQRITTIPTGEGWPLKCSDYDQSATVYDNTNRPLQLGCEFIEFSPF